MIVGTGTGSAKESLALTRDAKEAGADYCMIISPGYFAFALGKNREALKDFFVEVIEKSALPVSGALSVCTRVLITTDGE